MALWHRIADLRALCVAAMLFAPAAVWAHAANTSYLKIESADPSGPVRLTWDLNAVDLDWTVDLDLDTNGFVTWGEVQERRDAISTLVLGHLKLERGSSACALSVEDLALTRHTDATFVSLLLRGQCPASGALAVSSSLFFSQDASQRVLIDANIHGQMFSSVLSPQAPRWTQPAAPSAFGTFARFVGQGVWHVWIGYDHIAFVLLLLLPSVLRGSAQGWQSSLGAREVARDLLGVVTAFTVAHSVTLSLAATRTVELPDGPVEISIAASIIAAGLLNLNPGAARWRLPLAFGFGLMHGFGFANALAEIDRTGAALVPMLAGFNIGVELAQLMIVALALPFLLRLRTSSFYAARLMPAASLATAIAGAAWLAARLP